MTRIGIISDIHAHLDGLERALKHLKKLCVDMLVCTGDLVDRGADGDEVVTRIRELEIPTVQGNHDGSARHMQQIMKRLPMSGRREPPLMEETIQFLTDLPRTYHLTIANHKICLSHGSPSNFHERVEPYDTPPRFKRVIKEAGAKIVLLGHTHVPMVVRVENHGMIINAGSTFQNYAMRGYRHLPPTFAVLGLPKSDVTHYDVDTGDVVAVPTVDIRVTN